MRALTLRSVAEHSGREGRVRCDESACARRNGDVIRETYLVDKEGRDTILQAHEASERLGSQHMGPRTLDYSITPCYGIATADVPETNAHDRVESLAWDDASAVWVWAVMKSEYPIGLSSCIVSMERMNALREEVEGTNKSLYIVTVRRSLALGWPLLAVTGAYPHAVPFWLQRVRELIKEMERGGTMVEPAGNEDVYVIFSNRDKCSRFSRRPTPLQFERLRGQLVFMSSTIEEEKDPTTSVLAVTHA
jgi:hypothetical protein